jgi:hypothetical protein
MVRFYIWYMKNHPKCTIDDIPTKWREKVREELARQEAEKEAEEETETQKEE